jgi:type III restriction enzyme
MNDPAAPRAVSGPFGLVAGAIEALRGLFERTDGLRAVWVFGSRARGDHRDRSDVDLALDAPGWTERDALRLKDALLRLPIVYPVDVVLLNDATPAALRAAIERDRRPFWQRARGEVRRAPTFSIEPKPFQREALKRYADWLQRLAEAERAQAKNEALLAAMEDVDVTTADAMRDTPRRAWEKLRADGALPPLATKHAYSSRWTAEGAHRRPIPNVCFKVPTGGGKTLLAAAAVASTFASYYRRSTGLVLWVVPNDAIYRQTLKALANRDHPYRQMLLTAGAGRVKLLEKSSAISRADVESHLVVLLLMLQSAARQSKETLRLFRDRGDVHGFFPREDDLDGHWNALQAIPNLDVYAPSGASPKEARATRGSLIKDSLGNVLRLVRPMVVIDEGHHSYTPTALSTIDGFNPSLVLELSATPRVAEAKKNAQGANILVDVRGTDLDAAEMIKLPINVDVRSWADWKSCLTAAVDKLRALDADAQRLNADTLRYIRPILLVQVERTGKEQRDSGFIHAADARAHLLQLGLHEDEIAEKTSEKDELKQPENQDLLSPANKIRVIITKQALQEGWDCPFAYILCALAAGRQPAALTQLVGRILRQPETLKTGVAALDECYVYCNDARTAEVVKAIKASLEQEGMGDLTAAVRPSEGGADGAQPRTRRRRSALADLRIFLPRVTIDDGHGRRELVYDSDVLAAVDWASVDASALLGKWAPDADGPSERMLRFDLSVLDDRGRPPEAVVHRAEPQKPDRARIVRALVDIVPNPWLVWRWVDAVLAGLKERGYGYTEAKVAGSIASLIQSLRQGLACERDRLAEATFLARVARGEISFSLLASTLDYELPMELTDAGPARAPVLMCDTGRPPQKSLFEPMYAEDFNGLEAPFACYLDSQSALRWWHRNVARTQYGLQGWRRDKVYPDFVFAKATHGGADCLVVMETKGLHLANTDDTLYKQRLFAALTRMYEQAPSFARAGELTLESAAGVRLVCDMVIEPGWQGEIAHRHFNVPAQD